MSDYKEFQGKTLEEAMSNACEYFNADREKLEIDILEDAKTGVFGIIGARKARIQARKAVLPGAMTNTQPVEKEKKKSPSQQNKVKENTAQAARPKNEEVAEQSSPTIALNEGREAVMESVEQRVENPASMPVIPPTSELSHVTEKALQPISQAPVASHRHEHSEQRTDEEYQAALKDGKEVVAYLIKEIVDDAQIEAEVNGEKLCFSIETESSGLLIGKEGQTLSSLEYIAARILTKKLGYNVRLQIEVGDYRSRQDQRLHEFALLLADRVRTSKKPASTRPLSAYQRRIVHLALQDMSDLQTRSIGEGSLKRVVISKVRTYR